jgi:flavin-binding protein dodecin
MAPACVRVAFGYKNYLAEIILTNKTKEGIMTIARVTEISASSKKSFEDAVEKGVERACKTLKNVTGAWVKDQEVSIKDGKVDQFIVKMKVSFVLADD